MDSKVKYFLSGAAAATACMMLYRALSSKPELKSEASQSSPPRGKPVPGMEVDTKGVLEAGRVAVVIGSASGIGLSAAKRFAQMGMKVVLADIDAADLKRAAATCAELSPHGSAAIFSKVVDCSSLSDMEGLRNDVYDKFGEVAFLMNNAAIQNNGDCGPYEYRQRWQQTLNVNLWGVINGVQTFVPAMIAQGTPCVVVNTGSKQGITFPPGDTAYNVSKAGVKVLTEALQHKLRNVPDCKVSAFLLVPGWTITMIRTRAEKRLQGAAFDPSKAEDERMYRGSSTSEAIKCLEQRGAWPAHKVVDTMVDAVRTGAPFYIICPDHETSRELDDLRIQWASDDLVYRRVPLSRWSSQYGKEYKAISKGL